MSSNLSKKSALITLPQLRALPLPKSLGAQHNPVPHHLLVETLQVEARERGYTIEREQFALGMHGSALFGVMDLMPPGVVDVRCVACHGLRNSHPTPQDWKSVEFSDRCERFVEPVAERGLSLGFRNSTNATLAIKVVAGTRVFVCDNLALSGDLIAVLRRNTKGLDLGDALRHGFDKFLQHAIVLDIQIARLQAMMITDLEAKAKVFDIFAARVVPIHLFDDVEQFYFHPADEMTDCQPRTAWALHNAFTRAMKKLGPTSAFNANVALGRAFEMVNA